VDTHLQGPRYLAVPLELSLDGMKRRCLVFDLDGTISDPALGIVRSMNHALAAFGFDSLSATCVSNYIGPPIDDAFRALVPLAKGDLVMRLVAKFRERYSEVGYSENVLYPGISENLQYLVRNGIPLGVCTTKRVDFAERILKHFEIRDYFEFVSGGDVGIQKRQQLENLLTERVIGRAATMIGDRSVDIKAAHANGLFSVGVLWGHGTEAELLDAGAQRLLSCPSQIGELADAA
jgi:phosphoglycolate phosphatase